MKLFEIGRDDADTIPLSGRKSNRKRPVAQVRCARSIVRALRSRTSEIDKEEVFPAGPDPAICRIPRAELKAEDMGIGLED
jgi:hypothetical protein